MRPAGHPAAAQEAARGWARGRSGRTAFGPHCLQVEKLGGGAQSALILSRICEGGSRRGHEHPQSAPGQGSTEGRGGATRERPRLLQAQPDQPPAPPSRWTVCRIRGASGREGRVTQPQGLPGPPAARLPSPSNPGASADTHTTTSPGGTDTPSDLGPSASPRRRGLRSPPPHTRQSSVYTHKQLGAGGDASPPGWECTPRRQPPLPFTRRNPLSAHTCPRTPTLKTPRNQTANAAHRRASDSRLSFNVNGETYPTQMRGPRDASLRCTQAPASGPQGQHSSAADKPPLPLPAAHPHTPTTAGVRDSHLLAEGPEPEPGSPATASWLFRACQLNPGSAGQICSPGPITPRRQE